ncbi:MAG: pyridoxal phosphate-dependent aminotransferase [Desulfurellaceae bacterium]|nr:pyridoxal phosphate-dependent aminotransferase [Desulfurellaceae bacterium]
MRESRRMREVQTPIIPVIAELIRATPGTVSLGQGVAYYGPPPEALEAVQQFQADPANHKYTLVQGIDPLLEVIRHKLLEENGIALDETQRIVVTAGGNMAFMNALLAITDPGDQIILQLPYYFNHEMAISMVNCEAVCVPTNEHYQLQLDATRNAITDRTRAIVTVSPNNPAGVVYAESDLRAVNALCREAGIYHISDEAYEYFTYDGARHFSPGSIADSGEYTISLYSLSKAYGFASWRIGWMVAPDHLYTAIKKAQDTILICPPVVSQYAAVAAMQVGSAYCREKLGTMTATRRIIRNALNELGELITLPRSDGAFYFLLRVRTDMDAMTLAERLIREHRVAVIPSTAFGLTTGCYMRLSYGALGEEIAAEASRRLVHGLRRIVQ